MTGKILTALAALTVAAGSADAQTGTYDVKFAGPNVSGMLTLTYMANPNTGVLPQTSPNPVDPIGSYVITGATGTFSDANLGIVNAMVTGVADLSRVDPEPSNHFAPNSFSLLPVTNGVPGPDGLGPGLHFDNLLYPDGSPRSASDYKFHGGIFDIYGLIFTIDNGDYVNLWSDGYLPGAGLLYGVGVTDKTDLLDYVDGVKGPAVPEPASWALMLAGFGAVGGAMRVSRRRTAVSFR